MYTRPDGEKVMKMSIENKNLVYMNDFIMDIVKFFRKPFDGSDQGRSSPFFRGWHFLFFLFFVQKKWKRGVFDEFCAPLKNLGVAQLVFFDFFGPKYVFF